MPPTKFSKRGDSSFPESTADVNGNKPSDRARRMVLFHRTRPVITMMASGPILVGCIYPPRNTQTSDKFTKINKINMPNA